MNSDELRNYATVFTAIIALLVFAANSFAMARNRRIENVSRFNECHQRLFAPGSYLHRNITAIADQTMRRDPSDDDMEKCFHLMLLEIERLAILANNGAVPRLTQVYMFGSYARHVRTLISPQERGSMFWELAVGYLDGLAKDSDTYEILTPVQRARFWR